MPRRPFGWLRALTARALADARALVLAVRWAHALAALAVRALVVERTLLVVRALCAARAVPGWLSPHGMLPPAWVHSACAPRPLLRNGFLVFVLLWWGLAVGACSRSSCGTAH